MQDARAVRRCPRRSWPAPRQAGQADVVRNACSRAIPACATIPLSSPVTRVAGPSASRRCSLRNGSSIRVHMRTLAPLSFQVRHFLWSSRSRRTRRGPSELGSSPGPESCSPGWPSDRAGESELPPAEAEMLCRVVVDVGDGHEILEERVPADRVVHAAAQMRVGLAGEATVQRCDDRVRTRRPCAGAG